MSFDENNDLVTINLTPGTKQSIWNKLKENTTGLGYTEEQLQSAPELFVYIAKKNELTNFRNLWTQATSGYNVSVPKRDKLADVIQLVKANPGIYLKKYYDTVEMDRCIQPV